jgi:phosphoribosylaminoimidazole-succinocarboxamide synthase
MTRLMEVGIPTHFLRTLNMREQLVRAVDIVPIEIVVRNVAAGSLSRRLGVEEGTRLPKPLVEFYYKSDKLDDPHVSEEHIFTFGWADPMELEEIRHIALRINDYLCGLFTAVGLRLIDFKLEFGRLIRDDMIQIILADEITPDSCRLWDVKTNEKLDKDLFRHDLGDIVEAYKEVARRLGIYIDNFPAADSDSDAADRDEPAAESDKANN